jgi:hypothetical protein
MGKRFAIEGNWVPHTKEMLESAAWRHLPDKARRALSRLELEHLQHAGLENGKLRCTYDDFAAAGLRKASVSLAIRQCVALGFVEITSKGKRAIAEHRTPSLYRLTYVFSKFIHGEGREPTQEWRRADTDEKAIAALKRAEDARNYDTQPSKPTRRWPPPNKNKIPDAPVRPVPDAPVRPVT